MRHRESDALHVGWANGRPSRSANLLAAISDLITKTLVIVELEVRKLWHDPSDIFLRTAQPALWLLIFGQVFSRIRAIPTNGLPYLDFMAAGILAQSVLFMAIFTGGMAIIWEKDLGIVHKFLASPTPRVAMVLGKSLSSGVRSLPQIVIIYGLSLLLGVKLNFNPLAIVGVVLIVIMGAVCFSTFSLIIGCLVKTRERFTGIGQLMTMPLFFASNAIYPISLMPKWLQMISHLNPLTYQVDALRGTMLANGTSTYGFAVDFTVLLFAIVVMTVISGRLYSRVVT
ncbi:ABC-2 type transporter [Scytonema sp. HK-05]|uniref:ABC transporter permease n=1 Tax=Scytonema sp. HK-05 TaxID=1137095 RepID=UPI0009372362|nr:ABC transporter permease [Scytonema sp. HK-05]OKH55111.1 multidrug ABC transporter permease [Scytonema sp. HK-05]BAY43869.1 ABC-2 type transporter [Scytonema sp. HK-05]